LPFVLDEMYVEFYLFLVIIFINGTKLLNSTQVQSLFKLYISYTVQSF